MLVGVFQKISCLGIKILSHFCFLCSTNGNIAMAHVVFFFPYKIIKV